MRSNTAIADGMRRAGYDIEAVKLNEATRRIFKNVKNDAGETAKILCREAKKDDELLSALVSAHLRTYLAAHPELRSEGHPSNAVNSQRTPANAAQPPFQSEGPPEPALNGQAMRANALEPELQDKGQICFVGSDQHGGANVLQPERDGEANEMVPEGQTLGAKPSHSLANGEGHDGTAKQGLNYSARPVREPSRAQLDANLSAAHRSASRIYEDFKVDGRGIGSWTIAEARRLGPRLKAAGRRAAFEGRVLEMAGGFVRNADNRSISEVINPADLKRIIDAAEKEMSDAVAA